MPLVTPRERRLARAMGRDNGRAVRWGVAAATVTGARLMRAVLAAYRRRDPRLIHLPQQHLLKIVPQLRDAMTMAQLTGLQRGRQLASLSLGYEQAIGVLTRRMAIPHEQLVELGNRHEMAAVQMLTKASDAVEHKLQETMLEITQRGMHVREGRAALGEAFTSLGLTPRSSFQLEAIFRTQTQTAYSAGLYDSMCDPDIDEILWGYKYVTVGDDRVRDSHVGLEGMTLPKDSPEWDTFWPPNGWACRCVPIPIYEPREAVRPEAGLRPDKGFDYHPGKVLGGDGASLRPGVGPRIGAKPKPAKQPVPVAPEVSTRSGLGQAIHAEAAEWGVDPGHLSEAVDYLYIERAAVVREIQTAKAAAHKLTGLPSSTVRRLENEGFDYSSGQAIGGKTGARVGQLDVWAPELARQHPELELGDPDGFSGDLTANLWDLLSKPRVVQPQKIDLVRDGVELVYTSQQTRGAVLALDAIEDVSAVPF